jgi:hypothetical protein
MAMIISRENEEEQVKETTCIYEGALRVGTTCVSAHRLVVFFGKIWASHGLARPQGSSASACGNEVFREQIGWTLGLSCYPLPSEILPSIQAKG